MPNPIRVLPKELAEKIAAGEVVERPGSVVKELIENSLDAKSTEIRIELDDGGKRRIAILDNGTGIPEAELEVALERHATSKIERLDDLWNLRTMGFRGEALPSIAAVSRFTIESRAARSAAGRGLYLEGGRIARDAVIAATSPLQATATGTGTMIAVEDLFFNVPARLRFLKSKASEAGFIRELVERVALCNPDVAFTLMSDGRKSLALERGCQAARVASVLEVAEAELEAVEAQFEDIVVRGWLDRNGRASNSRQVYLAVNGRMVRDKLLQQAVLVGLRPAMMEGEYPRIYLSVEVDPADVDVNVHPAKSEVRFRRARDVFQVVHGALERVARSPSKAFYSTDLPEAETAPAPSGNVASLSPATRPAPEPLATTLFPGERVSYKTKEYLSVSFAGLTAAFEQPGSGSGSGAGLEQHGTRPGTGQEPYSDRNRTETETETETATVTLKPGFSKLQYIGQLKNTYLLFQDSDGLVVVDQHAAHERINYERLKNEFASSGLRAQPLLVSAVVKCKAEDIAVATENLETFARLGFEFEAFGDNCLLIREAPEAMKPDRAAELFRALLEELKNDENAAPVLDPTRLSARVERMIATQACHSSVRAGQALSMKEATELAGRLDETEASLNCPHGRPASVKLTFSQIEGLFKR